MDRRTALPLGTCAAARKELSGERDQVRYFRIIPTSQPFRLRFVQGKICPISTTCSEIRLRTEPRCYARLRQEIRATGKSQTTRRRASGILCKRSADYFGGYRNRCSDSPIRASTPLKSSRALFSCPNLADLGTEKVVELSALPTLEQFALEMLDTFLDITETIIVILSAAQ